MDGMTHASLSSTLKDSMDQDRTATLHAETQAELDDLIAQLAVMSEGDTDRASVTGETTYTDMWSEDGWRVHIIHEFAA